MDSCLRDSLCNSVVGTGMKGLYAFKNAHSTTESDIMLSYTVIGHGGQQNVMEECFFVEGGGLIVVSSTISKKWKLVPKRNQKNKKK